MTLRRLILILAFLLPAMAGGRELSFKTNTVRDLCFEMSLESRQIGSSQGRVVMGEKSGAPWYVDVDSTGFVSHVGYKLFNGDVRDAIQGEIADFIERYMLEISLCKKTQLAGKLRDDRVAFLSGKIPEPGKLLDPESFSLTLDEEGYTAEWNKGAANHFMMFFPASYELILGAGQAEIEKTVFQELKQERTDFEQAQKGNGIVVALEGDILRSNPVEAYYSLSDVCYFRAASDGGNPIPVYDSGLPVESVHDLFLLDGYDDLDLHITQSLYGFKTVSYTVTLGQWKNLCARSGLKTFLGIESVGADGTVKVLLIARNESIGYNHMLSITMQTDVFDGKTASVEAVLHAYIPTHNIKDLFADA